MSEGQTVQTSRRGFLQALGLGVAGLAVGWPFRADAQAAWNGRLLLYVHASGGWDPTSFCDPKGRETADSPEPVNHYLTSEIRTANAPSPLTWAPMAANEAFFQTYGDRLLVINGLDTSTNGHESGTRYACSGTLADTHPALAALYAGVFAADKSMPFLTNGAFDSTRGVVARTRVSNMSALDRLADTQDVGNSTHILPPDTMARIAQANADRETARLAAPLLPRERLEHGKFTSAARTTENGISRLKAQLPDLNTFATALGKQGAIALAAWRAGLSASAQLTIGGFDTHSNHDNNQSTALTALTQGLGEVMREIARLNAEGDVVVVVGSDFGRTPVYNDGNGKDHWPVTSMVALGAGIRGNRVIGGSTPDFRARAVDPAHFQPVDGSANGVVLTPAHVHRALRTLLGLTGTTLDQQFPINVEELGLFA